MSELLEVLVALLLVGIVGSVGMKFSELSLRAHANTSALGAIETLNSDLQLIAKSRDLCAGMRISGGGAPTYSGSALALESVGIPGMPPVARTGQRLAGDWAISEIQILDAQTTENNYQGVSGRSMPCEVTKTAGRWQIHLNSWNGMSGGSPESHYPGPNFSNATCFYYE